MVNELKNLQIEEVSAVDDPANKASRVVLLKRGGNVDKDEKIGFVKKLGTYLGLGESEIDDITKGGDDVADKDIKKQVADLTDEVKKLTADKARAEKRGQVSAVIAKSKTSADIEAVRKALDEIKEGDAEGHKELSDQLDARAEELGETEKAGIMSDFRGKLPKGMQKAFDDMNDDDKRRFMGKFQKGMIEDDPIGKALEKATDTVEKQAERIERLEKDAQMRDLREHLDDLKGTVEDFDGFVKSFAKMREADEDAAEQMVKSLRAAKAQAEKAGIFRVIGKDGDGDQTAEDTLDKAVQKYMGEHDDVTKEQAEAKVLERQPELYENYNKEREGARREA